jgi:hypothetical protein
MRVGAQPLSATGSPARKSRRVVRIIDKTTPGGVANSLAGQKFRRLNAAHWPIMLDSGAREKIGAIRAAESLS